MSTNLRQEDRVIEGHEKGAHRQEKLRVAEPATGRLERPLQGPADEIRFHRWRLKRSDQRVQDVCIATAH